MKLKPLTLLFVFTLVAAGFVVAADEMTVSGTVMSSSGSTLVIRSDAGEEMTFHVDSSSRNASGLTVGQSVDVTYTMDGGQNHVTSVSSLSETTGSESQTGVGTASPGGYDSPSSSRLDSERGMPATASPLGLLVLGGVAALGGGAVLRNALRRDS